MKKTPISPGMRFHKLTVLYEVAKRGKERYLAVRCDCGNQNDARLSHLVRGHVKSCGCLRGQHDGTHNMSRTPEYRAWQSMKTRCLNPNIEKFHNWGGRGIEVCDRWKNSFEHFFADLGKRPGKGYSLERINNQEDYRPGNCKWATWGEQARNRRKPCSR